MLIVYARRKRLELTPSYDAFEGTRVLFAIGVRRASCR